MKKTMAIVSLGVVSALSFTGLLSNSTYAATNQATPMKMQQQEMKVHIKSVTVVNKMELKLSGDNVDFMNRSLCITAKDGSTMMAAYDAMKGTFVLQIGQSLTPGVVYEISAPWAEIPEKKAHIVIADLLKVTQIAPNKIELVYDRPVDLASTTNPGNYWVVSNQDQATGIANIGKNDMITPTNGLTVDQVTITPLKHSMTHFVMTFKANAMSGVQYKVVPCFVNVRGATGYMAGNFTDMSMLTFIGK